MSSNPTWEAWAWARLLFALDKAGYIIMRKPTLRDKGRPRRPGP